MLISIDVKFPSSSHFSRQFHGIQGCLDLQILSKQQKSFFELYFCCICCFYAVVVLFLLCQTYDFSAILSCSSKTTQPSQQPANRRRISGRRFSPSDFGGREATTGNASAVRRLPSQLLSIFLASCFTVTSFSKHPGSVKQGHPKSISGKYLFGRRYEIQDFQNIFCKICCLPASPRTFEHLKNGMAFFTDFYCKKVTQNFRESFFQRKFLKK